MSIFKEVCIKYKSKEYKIPANRVMGLVETVEEVITIEELASGKLYRAKMAKAFSAAINYAGGYADREEVYSMFFDASNSEEMAGIINSILQLMIPPEHLQNKEEAPEEGNEKAPRDDD